MEMIIRGFRLANMDHTIGMYDEVYYDFIVTIKSWSTVSAMNTDTQTKWKDWQWYSLLETSVNVKQFGYRKVVIKAMDDG